MAGSNQALNLTGMLGGISGAINGAGQTGINYADNIRELMRPDLDMNDAASVQKSQDWANRNGKPQQAAMYGARSVALGDEAKEQKKRDSLATMFTNKIPTLPADQQEQARVIAESLKQGTISHAQALSWLQGEKDALNALTPNDRVQRSDIYANGATIKIFGGGKQEVTTADGITYRPGDDGYAEAQKEASESGIAYAGAKANAVATAESDVRRNATARDTSLGAYKGARRYAGKLDKAIALIDEGAGTGWFESNLPSLKDASIELDALRKELGLEIVNGTTFGALSKGELDLALDVAFNENLSEEAARAWLVERRDAQHKLADEMYKAMKWLDTNPDKDMVAYEVEVLGNVGSTETPNYESGQSQQQPVETTDAGEGKRPVIDLRG